MLDVNLDKPLFNLTIGEFMELMQESRQQGEQVKQGRDKAYGDDEVPEELRTLSGGSHPRDEGACRRAWRHLLDA